MKKNNCFREQIKAKVDKYTQQQETLIKEIIKENCHLPVHEIKRKVKRVFSDITNEDMERLICDINTGTINKNVKDKEKDFNE